MAMKKHVLPKKKSAKKHSLMKKKVLSHLKSDIKTFKKEAEEDKELIAKLKHSKKSVKPVKSKKMVKSKKSVSKKSKPGHAKFKKVLKEFKEGKLHSGSKKGPKVRNPKQAIAIAFSEDRRADHTAKGGR